MRAPDPESTVWLDGRFGKASSATVFLEDPLVLAGEGVFETIGVRAGAPLDLDAHLDRMEAGARTLGFPVPQRRVWVDAIDRVAASLGAPVGWVKLLCGGSGTRAVFGGTLVAGPDPATAVVVPWRAAARSPLSAVKSTSRAWHMAVSRIARERGADEGIWLTAHGHVAEGTTSNVFVVRGGRLRTPAVSEGVLPGIARERMLRAAAALGIACHEGKVRLPTLRNADEAFLTSAVRGVRPLGAIDGRTLRASVPGPVTVRLAERFARIRRVKGSRPVGATAPV